MSDRDLLDGIYQIGPRRTLIRATVCQHIWAWDLIAVLKKVGITDVFWSHTTKFSGEIEGIRVHPFPLYPVQACKGCINASPEPRDLLFSFVGAFDRESYLTNSRAWICELPQSDAYYVSRRTGWHFEQETYREMTQSGSMKPHSQDALNAAAEQYKSLMCRSEFALCPSGTGPNSIRFWEALGFGAIPVLISDDLALPGGEMEWDNAIVRIGETKDDIDKMPETLQTLSQDRSKIDSFRYHGKTLWKKYVEKACDSIINPVLRPEGILKILAR